MDEELVLHIIQSFTDNLAVDKTQLEKLKKETSSDLALSEIINIPVHLMGWPTDKKLLKICLKPY